LKAADLLTLGRDALKANLSGAPFPSARERWGEAAACFVSLHHISGSLRGCMGTLTPATEDLALEVCRNAVIAGTRDPRFLPVTLLELEALTLSVSVLKPMEALGPYAPATQRLLDPKRWGILVQSASKQGVLLPNLKGVDSAPQQVALVCRKAGIAPEEPFQISRFEVDQVEE
jgi:hypothetical protein